MHVINKVETSRIKLKYIFVREVVMERIKSTILVH